MHSGLTAVFMFQCDQKWDQKSCVKTQTKDEATELVRQYCQETCCEFVSVKTDGLWNCGKRCCMTMMTGNTQQKPGQSHVLGL